jgi:cytochrome c-type biogenesis protein CcmH/NrfF
MTALAAQVEPQHLADHPLLFAVPVLVPAFVVVLLVALVVIRDRRRNGPDRPEDDDEQPRQE